MVCEAYNMCINKTHDNKSRKARMGEMRAYDCKVLIQCK